VLIPNLCGKLASSYCRNLLILSLVGTWIKSGGANLFGYSHALFGMSTCRLTWDKSGGAKQKLNEILAESIPRTSLHVVNLSALFSYRHLGLLLLFM
jgi:hypothetical protein